MYIVLECVRDAAFGENCLDMDWIYILYVYIGIYMFITPRKGNHCLADQPHVLVLSKGQFGMTHVTHMHR
jgi:hypothetical protein